MKGEWPDHEAAASFGQKVEAFFWSMAALSGLAGTIYLLAN